MSLKTILISLIYIGVIYQDGVSHNRGADSGNFEGRSKSEMQSSDVLQNVKRNLVVDELLSGQQLKVLYRQGIITLTGEVGEFHEKERAVAHAYRVNGVKSVIDRIRVKDDESSQDENVGRVNGDTLLGDIAYASGQQLQEDPDLNKNKIITIAETRKIIETNDFSNFNDKKRKWEIPDLERDRELKHQHLKINWNNFNEPMGDLPNSQGDNAVKILVERTLFLDPRVDSLDVTVKVEDGIVNLSGKVDSFQARTSAESDAYNTKGVWKVVNDLKVEPKKNTIINDKVLKDQVSSAIEWDPYLDQHKIDISVKNRNVYLYGEVDNSFERSHATKLVSSIAGIETWANFLTVNQTLLSEAEKSLIDEVRGEFLWSLYLDVDDFTIEVDDQAVILTGNVNNWKQYKAAIDNALEAGARMVMANITVGRSMEENQVNPYLHGYYYNYVF